jgi:hypothetical protein
LTRTSSDGSCSPISPHIRSDAARRSAPTFFIPVVIDDGVEGEGEGEGESWRGSGWAAAQRPFAAPHGCDDHRSHREAQAAVAGWLEGQLQDVAAAFIPDEAANVLRYQACQLIPAQRYGFAAEEGLLAGLVAVDEAGAQPGDHTGIERALLDQGSGQRLHDLARTLGIDGEILEFCHLAIRVVRAGARQGGEREYETEVSAS